MAEDRIEVDTGTGELLATGTARLITLNVQRRNALSDRLTSARMIKQCGDIRRSGRC